MPIIKHKGVRDSAKVLLGGGYGRYFSHNLSRHGGETIVQRYIRSVTETFGVTGDQTKNLSAIGTLYHTFFDSLAPSISGKLHHHQAETSARSSCGSSPETSMSLFTSLHPGTKMGTKLAGGFSQKYRLASHVDIDFSSRFKGINQVRQLVSCLKNRKHRGSTVFYRSYWLHSGTLSNLTSNVHSGSKTFHSSSFSRQPVGAAHDISFDGAVREEQSDNSAASSGQTALADRTLKLLSGSCYLPHPDKEETGGEDAHFICEEGQAIGVADGVGGWADLGVNAGEYARELMSNSLNAIQEEPKGAIDPSRVLEKAYLCTKARGSSTACIIALTNQGVHAVNLGDSGFIVVRDGCTVFRSPVQQHDFNFTYQLESEHGSDLPSSAQVFKVSVDPGDVIIAGTDGLFDNLYNNEVTAVVVHAIRAGLGPQVTAQKIAALARQRAQDKNRQTPFSSAAQDAGYRYYGGKLDDITVVVSLISASNS